MEWRDDERGQPIQIGAVLLFGMLIIAFSMYQAYVIPEQNSEIEFNHNLEVQDDMLDLRNTIVSMPGGANPSTVSVRLGTRYPSRAVGLNPGPATGTVRTIGTDDSRVNLSIRNATASGETGDYWDGSERAYNTGLIVYEPTYNVYRSAPETVYEGTVLYNEYQTTTRIKTAQTLIDGNRLSLVVLDGSLSQTGSDSASVDVRPVSSSTRTVQLSAQNSDSPITLNFTSRLPATRWAELLSEAAAVESVTERPSAVGDPFHAVQLTLRTGQSYKFQLTKVGVGNRVTGEDAAYLTELDGEGTSVTRGESQDITVSVRDRYNNPVADVSVNASVDSGKGSVSPSQQATDDDGTATFQYRTTGSTATGTHRINFTTNDSSVLDTRPFEQSRPKNASVNVTVTAPVGGGGGGGGGGTNDPPDVTITSATHQDATGNKKQVDVTFEATDDDPFDSATYTVTVYESSSKTSQLEQNSGSYTAGSQSVSLTLTGNPPAPPYYAVVEVTNNGKTGSDEAQTSSV